MAVELRLRRTSLFRKIVHAHGIAELFDRAYRCIDEFSFDDGAVVVPARASSVAHTSLHFHRGRGDATDYRHDLLRYQDG
jgi:hypothetical protein